MAIGYDGGAYSGDLDEISRALGFEPDIEGVTSRLGTPVDPLGRLTDATILGLDMPYSESILARLAQHSPEVVRDLMRGRTYMAGTGLLGEGDMEDPLLQEISLMGNEQGDTINFGQLMGETYDSFLDRTMADDDEESSDVKKAIETLDQTLEDILPDTPPGTTDIFNAKTGLWEAVYEKMADRPSETSFVDEQVLDAEDDILSGTQSFEVATPLGTTDIFDTETGEWTALTDTEEEDDLIAQEELAELIALNPTGRFRDRISPANTSAIRRAEEMSGLTMGAAYPSIDTTVQDTQADVMDEGYLAGLNMTAEESRALTRRLNTLGRPRLDHEIEALKRGALINQQEHDLMARIEEEESEYNTGFLAGLSQAMKNVLQNDEDLMAQYMAARSDIIAQLDKDKFEHEDWYPGSQAAAVGAGYWGPLALGWNASYNDYKNAQRALMGKQAGQRFDSGDWINNLGWMTPDQINRLLGYGEP